MGCPSITALWSVIRWSRKIVIGSATASLCCAIHMKPVVASANIATLEVDDAWIDARHVAQLDDVLATGGDGTFACS